MVWERLMAGCLDVTRNTNIIKVFVIFFFVFARQERIEGKPQI